MTDIAFQYLLKNQLESKYTYNRYLVVTIQIQVQPTPVILCGFHYSHR